MDRVPHARERKSDGEGGRKGEREGERDDEKVDAYF